MAQAARTITLDSQRFRITILAKEPNLPYLQNNPITDRLQAAHLAIDDNPLKALLNNIKDTGGTTDKFWSVEKVSRPIMFISQHGTVISNEELAAKPATAFSMGNGVPLLDLELSHLQELSNNTTGLGLCLNEASA